jgi:transcriptional regulator with XRE-family HTH domain
MMRLGYSIKIIRTARGLTSASLAKSAGISPTYLSLIESGDRVPPSSTLKQIAEALDVGVDLLESFLVEERSSRPARISELRNSIQKLADAEHELKRRLG